MSSIEKIRQEALPKQNLIPEKDVSHSLTDILDEGHIELGLIDLEEIIEDRFEELTRLMQKLGSSQAILNTEINQASEETKKIVDAAKLGVSGRKSIKRVLTKLSSHMDDFTREATIASKDMEETFTSAMEAIQAAAITSMEDGLSNTDDLASLLNNLTVAQSSMRDACSKIQGFRESINSLPRMLQSFNKSKRNIVASADKLLDLFESGVRQIEAITSYDYSGKN